jgi:soluble lytic murein transglycosylase-like protein
MRESQTSYFLDRMISKLFLTLLLSIPAMAGEYAVLSSGLRIHVDRHERDGDLVRLYAKDGFTQLPAHTVAGFEVDDYVPPPPPPAPAATPVPEATQPTPPDPKALIRRAAVHSGLPVAFVESVAQVESALRSDAVSPKGALGVMQLMPATARALAADPKDPEQNIEAGTRLLRELLIKYDNDAVKALAAYNAGTGAVDRYQGLPPYPETQNYVNNVIRKYQQASVR